MNTSEAADKLLSLFGNRSRDAELRAFVSTIKSSHQDSLAEIVKNLLEKLSNQTKLNKEATFNRLKKLLLMPKSHAETVKSIEEDVNKQFSHLPESDRKVLIDEQVGKLENDRLRKKKRLQNKKANKEKTSEELLENFRVNLEKQLVHKSPEERKAKVDEEMAKYKELLDHRNKTIDQLVEEEKEKATKLINEQIEKKHVDKTPEEKQEIFQTSFNKHIVTYRGELEDMKIFHKRMEEKRMELEELKYADTVDGLDKMRKRIVEICIRQRKEFLGIIDDSAPQVDPNSLRTFEPGKGPIVKTIPAVPEEAPEDTPETVDDIDNVGDAEMVEIDANDIEPVQSEKELRILEKYKNVEDGSKQLMQLAVRDKEYFEHHRTEYIYHNRTTRDNFVDPQYYYKVHKFYSSNPDKKLPLINLLYWEKEIDDTEVVYEDIQKIDESIEREQKKQEELREKRRLENERAELEQKEVADIDEKILKLKQDLESKTIDEKQYNEFITPLIDRRNLLNPPEKTPEEQLQEYALDMREKYSRVENVRVERREIINLELQDYAKSLKREIAKERKLKDERVEKFDELSKDKKYWKDSKTKALKLDQLNQDVDEYIKHRTKELDKYFIPHGIDPKEHDDVAINNARIIFADYQKQQKTEVWKAMNAESKQDYLRTKYTQFFDSFPIVVKFMIHQDKFEMVAFKKFLEKSRLNVAEGANPYAKNIPKKGTKMLTPSEEKWLENQAFYVQYLVEEYRRRVGKRISTTEANWLRNQQLNALRSEMMDFRSNFEKVAEELKEDNAVNDERLLIEYIKQIKDGKVELSPEEQENIAFAIEQIVKRKEAIKSKLSEVESQSQKELVDLDKEVVADETSEPTPEPVPEPTKTEPAVVNIKKTDAELLKQDKKRLMTLKKKHNNGTISERELTEYNVLKNNLFAESKVEKTRTKLDMLDQSIGCHCLKYTCTKCTVFLSKTEQTEYNAKKSEIKSRDPKTWNIYESFIMREPNKNTVLLEYAGGHLEPVSVRQFLHNNEFTINGDRLDLINNNRKYGGFYKNT